MQSARESRHNLTEVAAAVKKALSGSDRGRRPSTGSSSGSPSYSVERGLHKTRSVLVLWLRRSPDLARSLRLNAMHVLSEPQTNDQSILRDFLQWQRPLDKIRSAIYLSGTYLRDYLLEPEPGRGSAKPNGAEERSRTGRLDTCLSPGVVGNGGKRQYVRRAQTGN
jgi:hypothetical protein